MVIVRSDVMHQRDHVPPTPVESSLVRVLVICWLIAGLHLFTFGTQGLDWASINCLPAPYDRAALLASR